MSIRPEARTFCLALLSTALIAGCDSGTEPHGGRFDIAAARRP